MTRIMKIFGPSRKQICIRKLPQGTSEKNAADPTPLNISRPYRAPELLFGPKTYDAFAADMWSAGATFADFFRPLKQKLDDVDEWDGCDEEAEDQQQRTALPFIFLRSPPPSRITSWHRLPLFNADRGDIGLAWSIFKVRGTPNETNWPVNVVNPSHVLKDLILPLGLSVFASC